MNSLIAALTDPAARAAAEAARQQKLKDTAARMARAKTGCAVTLADSNVPCGDPAVGLCEPCTKAFCELHASIDIGSVFLRAPDLCCRCQQRVIVTSLTEHSYVAATLKTRAAERYGKDQAKLKQKQRKERAKQMDAWSRRSGGALLGLGLVTTGGASGLLVDHVVTDASVPIDVPWQGVAVTPYALGAGIAVVLGLGSLFYSTRLGAGAARGGLAAAVAGAAYLTLTVGLLLSRSRAGELDWKHAGIALGAACLWLVGAHLAHRPSVEVRAQRAGKLPTPHPDRIIAWVIMGLLAVALGAAAYVLISGR